MGHGLGDIVSKEGPSQGDAYLSQVPLFFSFFRGLVTWNPPEAHGARGLVPEHVHGSVIFFRECKDTDTKR